MSVHHLAPQQLRLLLAQASHCSLERWPEWEAGAGIEPSSVVKKDGRGSDDLEEATQPPTGSLHCHLALHLRHCAKLPWALPYLLNSA